MKTALQKDLVSICPFILIRTRWTEDQHPYQSIFGEGCALHGEDPDEWQAWDSAITATATIDGGEVEGAAYLGGTWEKYGEDPATVNPEISGYENQMTAEALEDLRGMVEGNGGTLSNAYGPLLNQIDMALSYLKRAALASYEAQRAAFATVDQ